MPRDAINDNGVCDDTQALSVDKPQPLKIDLSGLAREPDQWQPQWIVEKYFKSRK